VAVALTAAAGVLASLSTLRGRQSIPLLGAYRGVSGPGPQRTRAVLTVGEIALATFLLVAGGVALRSFADLVRSDPGVAINGVATARVTALTRYAQREELASFFDRIVTSLAQTPGVRHAGLVSILPLSGDTTDRIFAIEGRPTAGQQGPDEQLRAVGGDYFQAMGIPLMGGRTFDARDTTSGERVAIISARLATKYWGSANPVGQRINLGGASSTEPWSTIVGIVGDVRHRGLDSAFVPMLYIPVRQFPERSLTVVARLEPWRQEDPRVIAEAVRAVDPMQPVFATRMMDEWMARSVSDHRFTLLLLVAFASLAIILTAVGIYGVMSSMVARRTRELGVRLALGARPATLLHLVLRRGAILTFAGLGAGLLAGVFSSAAFEAVFVGGRSIDPVVAGVVVSLVLGVALLACLVPARRAMRLDPIDALRSE
jgi:putative ABC transport system permease protein